MGSRTPRNSIIFGLLYAVSEDKDFWLRNSYWYIEYSIIQEHTCVDYQTIGISILFLQHDLKQLFYRSSECKDCEEHFCFIYLGQRTCLKHCRRQNCFCAHCQLYHIEIISPAVYCQRYDISSECYNYKHIGRVANRNPYVLGRYFIKHCPTLGCPNREASTMEMAVPTPLLYHSSSFYRSPHYGNVFNQVHPT